MSKDMSSEEFTNYLNERIPALMKHYQIPGASLALVRDGEIMWISAYGYADVQGEQLLTPDTPMRVQSISKPVTAWGVMKLAEQGKIDLNAPVSQYLKSWNFPESPFPSEQITVRQLLSHTSGLPLGDIFTIYNPNDRMPSLKEKLTMEAVPFQNPGSSFSYSNTGFNLLELMIEEVTGQSFAEYMEQEVLRPLDMENATFQWNETLNMTVPVGYNLNGKPVPAYVYPEKASGGLLATAKDIAAFAISGMPAYSNNRDVLNPEAIEDLYTPMSKKIGIYGLVFDAYGLGHYIETLPNGNSAVSHGGQGTGIMTHLHAVPETGDAMIILTNSQRSWPFISYILSDWAQWRSFPSVGMGKIIWGKYVLSVVIGGIWSAVLLLILKITTAKTAKKQDEKHSRKSSCIQALSAVAIIGFIIWCLRQKYLFMTSVFPIMSIWLGISLFIFASVLLLYALLSFSKQNSSLTPDSFDL